MGRRRGYTTVETMRGIEPTGRSCKGNHSEAAAGHLSIMKSKNRIVASYYWQGMHRDIQQNVPTLQDFTTTGFGKNDDINSKRTLGNPLHRLRWPTT